MSEQGISVRENAGKPMEGDPCDLAFGGRGHSGTTYSAGEGWETTTRDHYASGDGRELFSAAYWLTTALVVFPCRQGGHLSRTVDFLHFCSPYKEKLTHDTIALI